MACCPLVSYVAYAPVLQTTDASPATVTSLAHLYIVCRRASNNKKNRLRWELCSDIWRSAGQRKRIERMYLLVYSTTVQLNVVEQTCHRPDSHSPYDEWSTTTHDHLQQLQIIHENIGQNNSHYHKYGCHPSLFWRDIPFFIHFVPLDYSKRDDKCPGFLISWWGRVPAGSTELDSRSQRSNQKPNRTSPKTSDGILTEAESNDDSY